jgi:hypothetical protein
MARRRGQTKWLSYRLSSISFGVASPPPPSGTIASLHSVMGFYCNVTSMHWLGTNRVLLPSSSSSSAGPRQTSVVTPDFT